MVDVVDSDVEVEAEEDVDVAAGSPAVAARVVDGRPAAHAIVKSTIAVTPINVLAHNIVRPTRAERERLRISRPVAVASTPEPDRWGS